MIITSYKDLIAYKKAFEVVKEVYKFTRSYPQSEIYGMTSQIRRAAVSVPSNISEGYMRGVNEYAHFLRIALGSAAEVATLLTISVELNYCSDKDFERTYQLNAETMKLLRTYIKRISQFKN